ncbi:MAG TPA: hypothetical protein VKD25_10350 [Burkholderiales bacterium]|nr:hypothetical protein [Burkholderiales bacterium]
MAPSSILRRIASCAVCLFVATASHAASSPKTAAKVDRLLDAAGIAHSVRQLLPSMMASFDDPSQKLPTNVRYALREATEQAFQPEPMIARVRTRMGAALTERQLDDTLAWLDSPLGRRITALENESAEPAALPKILAYARELEKRPLSQPRAGLLREMDAATGASEVNSLMTEAGILAVALGMNAAQPVEQQVPADALRENVKASMPQLRQQVTEMVVLGMSYTYRSLSDQELGSYLKFLKSPSGAAYSKAAVAGMNEAILEANARFMQLIPKAIIKHKGTTGA